MAFNINAQVVLSGPKNLGKIKQSIQKSLGGSVPINLTFSPQAASNLAKFNSQLNAATAGLQKITQASSSFSNSLKTISNNAATAASAVQKVSNTAASTSQSLSQATNQMVLFGKDAALAVRRFAAFSIATGAIYGLIRSIQSATKEAIEFQREMNRLKVVTDGSTSQMKDFQSTVDQLSTSLGLSSMEIAKVGVTIAQSGRKMNEVKSIVSAIAKASLTPSFGAMEDTAEGVIAVLEQFRISADRTEAVLGSLNAVSKAFAVESADLIATIRKTGGVFATASVDLSKPEEALADLLGIFTSVRSTTRESAETIATGLRTIFSRLQRKSTIDFLKQFQIDLVDTEGKFVGFFESFRRLSEGLSGIQKSGDVLTIAKIVEELGGIRQVGKLIPAIQQFTKAEQARRVALEGTGSMTRDVAIATDTLAVKIQQLQQRFTKLFRDIADSSTFQDLAKFGISAANSFISMADALRPLLPMLTTLAAIKVTGAAFNFTRGFVGGLKKYDGGPIPRFAGGGLVPGQGNRDSVPARLTPGEYVIKKSSVEKLGTGYLNSINRNAGGIIPRRYANPAGRVAKIGKLSQDQGEGIALTKKQVKGFEEAKIYKSKAGLLDTASLNVAGVFLKPQGIRKKIFATLKDKKLAGIPGINNQTLKISVESGSISREFSKKYRSGLAATIANFSQSQAASSGLDFSMDNFKSRYKKANIEQVEGNIFESFVSGVAKPPFSKEIVNRNASFDFMGGLGSKGSDIFGLSAKGQSKPTDAKRTFNDASIGSLIKKAGNLFLQRNKEALSAKRNEQIAQQRQKYEQEKSQQALLAKEVQSPQWVSTLPKSLTEDEVKERIQKAAPFINSVKLKRLISEYKALRKAGGGSISGSSTDSVHALLTPGEFVISKPAAESIGYSNLARMNAQGKAAGGVIQKFANGGKVKAAGLALSQGFAQGAFALPMAMSMMSSTGGAMDPMSMMMIMGSLAGIVESVKMSYRDQIQSMQQNTEAQQKNTGQQKQNTQAQKSANTQIVQSAKAQAQALQLSGAAVAGSATMQGGKLTGASLNAIAANPANAAILMGGMGGGATPINKSSFAFKAGKFVGNTGRALSAGLSGFSMMPMMVGSMASAGVGMYAQSQGQKEIAGYKGFADPMGAEQAGTYGGLQGALQGAGAGATAGAMLGAAVGTIFPVVGNAVGAAVFGIGGAIVGGIAGYWMSSEKAIKDQTKFTQLKGLQDSAKNLSMTFKNLAESGNRATKAQYQSSEFASTRAASGFIKQATELRAKGLSEADFSKQYREIVEQGLPEEVIAQAAQSMLTGVESIFASLPENLYKIVGDVGDDFNDFYNALQNVISSKEFASLPPEIQQKIQAQLRQMRSAQQVVMLGAIEQIAAGAEITNPNQIGKTLADNFRKQQADIITRINSGVGVDEAIAQNLREFLRTKAPSSLVRLNAIGEGITDPSQLFDFAQNFEGQPAIKEQIMMYAQLMTEAEKYGGQLFQNAKRQQELNKQLALATANFAAFGAAIGELSRLTARASDEFNVAGSNFNKAVERITSSGNRQVSLNQQSNIFSNLAGRSASEINVAAEALNQRLFRGTLNTGAMNLGGVVSFGQQLPEILKKAVVDIRAGGEYQNPVEASDAIIESVRNQFAGFDLLPEAVKQKFTAQIKTLIGGNRQGEGQSGEADIGVDTIKDLLVNNPDIVKELIPQSEELAKAFEELQGLSNTLNESFVSLANSTIKANEMQQEALMFRFDKQQVMSQMRNPNLSLNQMIGVAESNFRSRVGAMLSGTGVNQDNLVAEKARLEQEAAKAEQDKDFKAQAKLVSALNQVEKAIQYSTTETERLTAIQAKLSSIEESRMDSRQKLSQVLNQVANARNPLEANAAIQEFFKPAFAAERIRQTGGGTMQDIAALFSDLLQGPNSVAARYMQLNPQMIDQYLAGTTGFLLPLIENAVGQSYQNAQFGQRAVQNVFGLGATEALATPEEQVLLNKAEKIQMQQAEMFADNTTLTTALLIDQQESYRQQLGITYNFMQQQAQRVNGLVNSTQIAPAPARQAANKAKGGMIYASKGGALINFQEKGTDTEPAMLTPGEFVVNARDTAKNLPLLKAINSGKSVDDVAMASRGGRIGYFNSGGMVKPSYFVDGGLGQNDLFRSRKTDERLAQARKQVEEENLKFATDRGFKTYEEYLKAQADFFKEPWNVPKNDWEKFIPGNIYIRQQILDDIRLKVARREVALAGGDFQRGPDIAPVPDQVALDLIDPYSDALLTLKEQSEEAKRQQDEAMRNPLHPMNPLNLAVTTFLPGKGIGLAAKGITKIPGFAKVFPTFTKMLGGTAAAARAQNIAAQSSAKARAAAAAARQVDFTADIVQQPSFFSRISRIFKPKTKSVAPAAKPVVSAAKPAGAVAGKEVGKGIFKRTIGRAIGKPAQAQGVKQKTTAATAKAAKKPVEMSQVKALQGEFERLKKSGSSKADYSMLREYGQLSTQADNMVKTNLAKMVEKEAAAEAAKQAAAKAAQQTAAEATKKPSVLGRIFNLFKPKTKPVAPAPNPLAAQKAAKKADAAKVAKAATERNATIAKAARSQGASGPIVKPYNPTVSEIFSSDANIAMAGIGGGFGAIGAGLIAGAVLKERGLLNNLSDTGLTPPAASAAPLVTAPAAAPTVTPPQRLRLSGQQWRKNRELYKEKFRKYIRQGLDWKEAAAKAEDDIARSLAAPPPPASASPPPASAPPPPASASPPPASASPPPASASPALYSRFKANEARREKLEKDEKDRLDQVRENYQKKQAEKEAAKKAEFDWARNPTSRVSTALSVTPIDQSLALSEEDRRRKNRALGLPSNIHNMSDIDRDKAYKAIQAKGKLNGGLVQYFDIGGEVEARSAAIYNRIKTMRPPANQQQDLTLQRVARQRAEAEIAMETEAKNRAEAEKNREQKLQDLAKAGDEAGFINELGANTAEKEKIARKMVAEFRHNGAGAGLAQLKADYQALEQEEFMQKRKDAMKRQKKAYLRANAWTNNRAAIDIPNWAAGTMGQSAMVQNNIMSNFAAVRGNIAANFAYAQNNIAGNFNDVRASAMNLAAGRVARRPIRRDIFGYASGGKVTGPSGIDNVPAMLTDGEYVINKSATYAIGGEVLDHINATGTIPTYLAQGGQAYERIQAARQARKVRYQQKQENKLKEYYPEKYAQMMQQQSAAAVGGQIGSFFGGPAGAVIGGMIGIGGSAGAAPVARPVAAPQGGGIDVSASTAKIQTSITQAFDTAGTKFGVGFLSLVQNFDTVVTKLQNLPALKISTETKVGPIEVVLNAGGLQDIINSKVMEQVAIQVADKIKAAGLQRNADGSFPTAMA